MMKTTTKRPSKAQIAREQIAKDERLRILAIIHDEIFYSDRPSAQLEVLREIHKLILDTSK